MTAPVIVANFQYEHRCGKHDYAAPVVPLRPDRCLEAPPEVLCSTSESPDASHLQAGEVWRQLLDASRKLSEMDANEAIAKTVADRIEDDKRMARLHVAMIWPPALWWEFWKRLGWVP